jgi:hypothetical protein
MAERFIIWCKQPFRGAADVLADVLDATPGVRVLRTQKNAAVVAMTFDTADRLRRRLPPSFAIEQDVPYQAVGS